ncbi:unnamed protein product [Adineta ricciae]|uniref:Fas-associated factor 1/2-like UAS domain-containing protein n=1 Tax=Adineta ricciae TaxID=249248 RepID=A0A815B0X5_ADIRI|nr:unnamed protein product [Adineta ricciae]CAF1261498.1 unnamed protein product [Adineta ricciae]
MQIDDVFSFNSETVCEAMSSETGVVSRQYMRSFRRTFQEARECAFNSNETRCRPLLICVHHRRSFPYFDVYQYMFYSEYLLEFLNENYTLWLCDITQYSNRTMLYQVCPTLFDIDFVVNDPWEQFPPILIGVLRQSDDELSDCEFELLFDGMHLIHTMGDLTLETLFDELLKFKDQFDDNEKNFVFDFLRVARLCDDMFYEIVPYMTLNDALTTFSSKYAGILQERNIKLLLDNPSDEFMAAIINRIPSELIIALRIKVDDLSSKLQLLKDKKASANVTRLILTNIERLDRMNDYLAYFANVTCLSLCYASNIDFRNLCNCIRYFPSSVKRLKIACTNVLCSHNRMDYLFSKSCHFNSTIEHLLISIELISTSIVNSCHQYHPICELKTIADFIRVLTNIQDVRIVVHHGNLVRLLDLVEWKGVLQLRPTLKKIVLKPSTNVIVDEQARQKALDIQQQMAAVNRIIEFEIA